MIFDVAAVQKVQLKISAAIWICAGIAMSASVIAGVTGFWNLQKDGWGIASGFMTSLAVDVALWVALTSDRLMESIGLTADGPWARTVRWGTAAMSIVLNILAAVLSPLSAGLKALLILIHAFAPMIMVGLAELRSENGRKLAAAERAAYEREEAQQARQDTPIATPSERISPAYVPASRTSSATPEALGGAGAASNALTTGQPEPTKALAAPAPSTPGRPSPSFGHPQRSLQPTSRPITVTPLSFRSKPPARRATPSRTPVKDEVFGWLDAHYVHGQTTVADLVKALDGSRDTYKKLLAEWRKLNEERTKEVAS